MKLPKMNGLEVLGLIGAGESGRVFGAKDNAGRIWAVKVFEGMAINRGLLAKMTSRLEAGGWPEGVMVLNSADFEGRPACWVMPMYAEMEGGGEGPLWRVKTLQHSMAAHPGELTWELVKAIGNALAGMHARRVPHGNLKPGNVLFDKSGQVKLTDWTLGNMPGITHFDYTDALLYQAPEQLVDPDGYFEEAGYRWDVFSFGVLAYRLLTGSFPRCNETFQSVAPAAGETNREGIHADAAKMAKNLISQVDFVWPAEASNDLEEGYRGWINRCLDLVPENRPVSMVELMAGFEKVETRVEGEESREKLMDQRRRAERSSRRVIFVAGMAAAACFVLCGLWYLTNTQLRHEQGEREREKMLLDTKATEAVDKMSEAVLHKDEAEQALEYERDLGLARLEASRLIGDRLFGWAMEKGRRNLPSLDGRELRLKRLQRFFEDFLRRTAEIKKLDDERARVRLQLAEVALAAGDSDASAARLGEAIDGWTGAMDGEMKLRIGRNALLLALLKQEKSEEDTAGAFAIARKSLEEVPAAEVDRERLEQLVAILDFHEAKLLAANGEDGKALEQLMGATQKLNELADARPDAAVLRSELAKCYLSSATILEGIGKLGDAREVRTLAAAEMVKVLKGNPGDVTLRLALAGCYGAMAEASVLSGDVGAAEAASTEAMKLLDGILKERPDATVAATRKAAQLGLQAGMLRDQGKAKEAMKAFEEGISLLEWQGERDALVDYRLALLWWQKGRMLGFDGKKSEEILLLLKAREALRELEAEGGKGMLGTEELQRSSAYLLGDLAHALELAEKAADAKNIYREAVVLWERLLKSRPQSEEYREGLEWICQRAKGV
ncbi:MAG: hypothetical protein IZT59_05565 [Verrucomicrobia bacterium]|jgi:hypothetical protein|nr:hypothetical protein [Verrucomicrobiota bacterium]|tara:strand:+ start:2343 stop:4868 length:2526 start_codon:yes stop_codon:yes gene_type:complete